MKGGFPRHLFRRASSRAVFTLLFADALAAQASERQEKAMEKKEIGLGTAAVGALSDERVKKVLGLDREESLYIMPEGRPR